MKYLDIHLDFLKKHETMPRKELTELFNNEFNQNVLHKALTQKCVKIGLVCGNNNGRFKKGRIPTNKGTRGLKGANKTSFKRGSIPTNTRKVGSIVKRKDKSGVIYFRIKIAQPNKWQYLHLYIWESKHGKIPKGHCVIFKDKNTINLRLDNLMLISRAELARLNQKYAYIDKSLKDTALQVIRLKKEVIKSKKMKR